MDWATESSGDSADDLRTLERPGWRPEHLERSEWRPRPRHAPVEEAGRQREGLLLSPPAKLKVYVIVIVFFLVIRKNVENPRLLWLSINIYREFLNSRFFSDYMSLVFLVIIFCSKISSYKTV
jgi:hypothetical protein